MEIFLPLASVVLILSITAIAWFAYRQHCQLKLRQMAHEERLAALHHNPELSKEVLSAMHTQTLPCVESPDHWLQRVRSFCLVIGLIFFFGGSGMLVAFLISDDEGLRSVWTLGFIPIFTGIGFLLYVVLSFLWPDARRGSGPTATSSRAEIEA